MNGKMRILVTGFGPFPGAPFNPTMPLVERLTQLRRPAFDDVDLRGHIFHVTYDTVDRELPELLTRHQPQAMLSFGLAAETRFMRVESRARNAITTTMPDADRNRSRKASIVSGADAMLFGPHTAKLLRAALATGIDARPSRNAGNYLCNYLSWRAIEATTKPGGPLLAAFVHVPRVARDVATQRDGSRITLEQLVDAGEAMLMEMARIARVSVREAALSVG